MTIQMKPSEWEALSAFLDNQLSERDRTRLEARLKSEPDLRLALEDLRRTRLILRSQPRLRAPRNFTLSPATAASLRPSGGRVRRLWSFASPFTTLRLASALATIFLILITVGDLAVRRYAPAPASVAVSQQEPGFARGMGGGGGGGGAAPEIAPLAAPTEAAAVVEAPLGVEALPGASSVASQVPDQQALVVTPLGSPEAQTDRSAKEPPTVIEGPPVQVANGQPTQAQAGSEAGAVTPPASTLIRVLQALLVMLALSAGAAAIWMRRNTG